MMRQSLVGAVVLLILFVLPNSVFVISETERGVMLKFGEVVRGDLEPGLHWKVPFVNNVRRFDGRIMTVDSSPERFFTQEKKALIVDSYAKFRVTDTAKFYTATSGEEIRAASLLSQRINDDLRNQVAVRSVQEVVSGERDQLMEAVKARLNESVLDELGVDLQRLLGDAVALLATTAGVATLGLDVQREQDHEEPHQQHHHVREGDQPLGSTGLLLLLVASATAVTATAVASVTVLSMIVAHRSPPREAAVRPRA